MQVQLSAVIITFNEEANIARCLDALQGVADEIVVLDSNSTDRTNELCRSYGAKFSSQPFRGHIEQKNDALALATYDHVLCVDADEVLSPELRDSILAVKANWQADGYFMSRLTSYCGKWIRHGGWYPDRKLRLLDRTKGHWGGHNPHDRIVMNKGATTARLTGDLLHYTFNRIEEHVAQVDKFSTIRAERLLKKNKRASILVLWLKPKGKFLRDYVLRGGFRDGWEGYVIARMGAHSRFLALAKLRAMRKQAQRNKPS